MRELLRLLLCEAGYQVATAEDAVEAGHCLLRSLPDLLIADFRMPYMDGVEFVRAMRADVTIPDIPVIFITGMENVVGLAGRTFGFPVLAKPLRSEQLLGAVQAALHR